MTIAPAYICALTDNTGFRAAARGASSEWGFAETIASNLRCRASFHFRKTSPETKSDREASASSSKSGDKPIEG